MSGWRRARRFIAAVLSVCALVGVVRLVVPAATGAERQLAFLRSELDSGAGERAQQLFPEGYFFLHALYGLAWVDVGRAQPSTRDTAVRAATWALERLESPAGRAPFSPSLAPPYGVFYRGWLNWLRGGVLMLAPDPGQQQRFEADSAALAAAFDASGSPYLPAYPGQAWPVDSTVAMASLRLHDALAPPRFAATIARWLAGVTQRLDPATGLMPHQVTPDSVSHDAGEPASASSVERARATSQSVIQRFLPEVDPTFAREQYLRFRAAFVASPLGLGPAVREYPAGTAGPSDVDSGPLVLGVSLSATVVTIGAARVQGDANLAGALANYGELAGLPIDTPWTKRYGFGLLPIGDAFLVWSKTAAPWVGPPPAPPPASVGWWWRLPLLALLLLVAVVAWLPELRARRRAQASVG